MAELYFACAAWCLTLGILWGPADSWMLLLGALVFGLRGLDAAAGQRGTDI